MISIDLYQALVYCLAYIGLFMLSFYVLSYFGERKKGELEKADNYSVSIIIAAYNEEKGIADTIKNALNIDYPKNKLEIIVVDDGSSDKTYEKAKAFEKFGVRVLTKKNGGKGSALNLGISKAKGEIVVSMDADTFANPDALQRMVARFYDKDVMAVTASGGIYKPRTLWQRIQHVEYYLTIFLRRTFASINSLYITAGAFSAYRKAFFKKHGGYDVGNITEDLEIALRIQSKDYIIENASEAVFYTMAPSSFRELLYQRRRWYTGLITNLWNYRKKLFGLRRGALGTLILPSVLVGTLLSVVSIIYTVTKATRSVSSELDILRAINFEFSSFTEINRYIIYNFLSTLFSSPVFVMTIFFILVLFFYLTYAKRKMHYSESLKINVLLFIALYSILFAFWWIISSFYLVFNKKVSWGGKKHG